MEEKKTFPFKHRIQFRAHIIKQRWTEWNEKKNKFFAIFYQCSSHKWSHRFDRPTECMHWSVCLRIRFYDWLLRNFEIPDRIPCVFAFVCSVIKIYLRFWCVVWPVWKFPNVARFGRLTSNNNQSSPIEVGFPSCFPVCAYIYDILKRGFFTSVISHGLCGQKVTFCAFFIFLTWLFS